MDIGKINHLNQVKQSNGAKKQVDKADKSKNRADRVSISNEAREMAQLQRAVKIVGKTEDIRLDRVSEVRQKLAEGAYNGDLSEKVAERLADKIIQSLGY